MLVVRSISDLPYVTHLGLPIHWRDDQSGKVSGAIWAYICHCADPQKDPAPGQEQLLFLKSYGPTATMERWKPAFLEMVRSLRKR